MSKLRLFWEKWDIATLEAGVRIYSFKSHGHFCFMVDKRGFEATLECPR